MHHQQGPRDGGHAVSAEDNAKWKQALAAHHKQQRQQRGKRADTSTRIGPGLVRQAATRDTGNVYDLVTVRLADREQPVMVAPNTAWLRQAVADGLLVILDQPKHEPGGRA
jgi:hypothetical protein